MRRDKVHGVAIPTVDISKLGVADPYGILQHGFKYGLKITGRAADNLEHLRRGGLLLQRLGKFSRALLLCLEQPHVFDGDGGLISERLQKSDVLFLERSHLGTADHDRAKRTAFADQRHGEGGTMSVPDRQFPP